MEPEEDVAQVGPPPARPPAYDLGVAVGAAAVVVAVTVLILQFTLNWLIFEPSNAPGVPAGSSIPTQTYDRDRLDDGFLGLTYFERLVDWPVVALAFAIVAGVALAAIDLVPRLTPLGHRAVRFSAFALLAYVGFVLALTGMRWLGFFIETLADPGDPVFILHAAPYVNLAAGLALLSGGSWGVWRDGAWLLEHVDRGVLGADAWRVPAAGLAVAALCLLLLPVVPFSVTDTSFGDTHTGEASYAAAAESDGGNAVAGDVGRDLGWVRWMLWTVLYVSTASCAAALMERSGRDFLTWGTLSQVYALNVVPVIIGVLFTVLAYVHMAEQDNTTITFNHLHTLALLLLAGTGLRFWTGVLKPYLDRAASQPQQIR